MRSAVVGTYIGKKELWGKGYGLQITVALLEIVFNQLNMDRCEASSVEYTVRAHRALKACGFRKVGVMRQSAFVNGRRWDRVYFDILRDEYRKIRMKLLKKVLRDKFDAYIEKHCLIKE